MDFGKEDSFYKKEGSGFDLSMDLDKEFGGGNAQNKQGQGAADFEDDGILFDLDDNNQQQNQNYGNKYDKNEEEEDSNPCDQAVVDPGLLISEEEAASVRVSVH